MAVSGICSGVPEENSGKIAGKLLEFFPESRSASHARISGTGKAKPAANIGSTLSWALCRPSVQGVFRNRQLQPSRVFLMLTSKILVDVSDIFLVFSCSGEGKGSRRRWDSAWEGG